MTCELELDGVVTTYADDTVLLFNAGGWGEVLKKSETGLTQTQIGRAHV